MKFPKVKEYFPSLLNAWAPRAPIDHATGIPKKLLAIAVSSETAPTQLLAVICFFL